MTVNFENYMHVWVIVQKTLIFLDYQIVRWFLFETYPVDTDSVPCNLQRIISYYEGHKDLF